MRAFAKAWGNEYSVQALPGHFFWYHAESLLDTLKLHVERHFRSNLTEHFFCLRS